MGPSLWDGVGMGTGTTGTVGDGDEHLSPCSSLYGGADLHLHKVYTSLLVIINTLHAKLRGAGYCNRSCL